MNIAKNQHASTSCVQYNAASTVEMSTTAMVYYNCYRPLSKVSKDKSLPRYVRRAIRFIKYRHLGCLPLSRGKYTVSYSLPKVEPFDVEVEPEYPVDCSMPGPSDSKIEAQALSGRTCALWEKYVYLRERISTMRLCYIRNGTTTDISDMKGAEVYQIFTKYEWYGDVKFCEYNALPGGVRKRTKKTKRKKGRKTGGVPLIRSVQLGQINRMVPYDKPIITTIRFNASLVTDGAGILSARLSLRNPQKAFNGTGDYVNAVDYAALYDQYKVKELMFQFEPIGSSKGPIVVSCDYDSPNTSTPNYANIVNYGGYRIFSSSTQFEIATRVPNITSAYDTSTDPPTALIVHQGGWLDAATPAAPGNMFFGGQNLGNSVTIGNFVATMRIAWRFRR